MIAVFLRDDHSCFRVRVQPRSSRTSVLGCWNQALKVSLTAPPIEDRANRQLCELLADFLDLPRASIKIVSGHRSRLKTVQVTGLSPHQLKNRITPYLA